jgi:hypothetical protein
LSGVCFNLYPWKVLAVVLWHPVRGYRELKRKPRKLHQIIAPQL